VITRDGKEVSVPRSDAYLQGFASCLEVLNGEGMVFVVESAHSPRAIVFVMRLMKEFQDEVVEYEATLSRKLSSASKWLLDGIDRSVILKTQICLSHLI